jgi:hypothetical protein
LSAIPVIMRKSEKVFGCIAVPSFPEIDIAHII